MCLIAFALNTRDDCPLLVASNRDEFWARPTQALSRWTLADGTAVYGGRDLQAGGTWLGFSEAGRVAMLTNVRSATPDVAPRSRGELVTRWLAGDTVTPDWQTLLGESCSRDYGGFNLVLGHLYEGGWTWLSNRSAHSPPAATALPLSNGWVGCALPPGIYGLSNAGLDTPWPKTRRLKQVVAHALQVWSPDGEPKADAVKAGPGWRALLEAALLDRRPAAEHELPSTGVPWDREQQLSSAFVHIPEAAYGTRSSLIAHWHASAVGGQLHLDEWTHSPSGPSTHSTHRRISMSTWGMPTSSYPSPTAV